MPMDEGGEKEKTREAASIPGILGTGLALLAMLAITSWAAYLPLGNWKLPVAMIISTLKMLLIALFFMELGRGGRTIWVFAAAGFFWILIMAGLTLSDYLTRFGVY